MGSYRENIIMRNTTIALYPSPGRGHLTPMVELGKLIARQAPCISITIIVFTLPHEAHSVHSFTRKVSLANPSITFIHLPTPANNLLPTVPPSSQMEIIASLFEVPKLCNHSLCEALSALSKASDLKALVIDTLCNTAAEVSSSLNIPTFYLCNHAACVISFLLSFPYTVHKKITNSLKDLDILLEFPGVPPIPSKDLPMIVHDRSHRVYNYFIETSAQMAMSSGLILNTFESLEPRAIEAILGGKSTPGQSKAPPLYCVGPVVSNTNEEPKNVNGEEQEYCLTWLDSQPSQSVLFLCFGSMGVLPGRQLKEMAIGLEKSGVRFLWVVRNPPEDDQEVQNQTLTTREPKFELESLLPDGFLDRTRDRGLVVKLWAPQFAVLCHRSVGGFVTHCGWNSVLEAVCAGVPMLAWPLYAEQKMNRVQLVEEMKVALAVRQSEDGFVVAVDLEEGVIELMNSKKGNVIREQVVAMKEGATRAMISQIAMGKLIGSFRGREHLIG